MRNTKDGSHMVQASEFLLEEYPTAHSSQVWKVVFKNEPAVLKHWGEA